MNLTLLTWNIGGGMTLDPGADPARMSSYQTDGMAEIKQLLLSESPDIITLQETHQNAAYDQVKLLADELGYGYFVHDSTSRSHIDPAMRLGHAIISRHPIISHQTGLFRNPNLSVEWEDGSQATSFDKGFTTCRIDVNGTPVAITTLHLLPFRRFNVELDSDQSRDIMRGVSTTISAPDDKWIIQGDFNIDSPTLQPYLPELFDNDVLEIPLAAPTTPKGHRYDHVLYRGLDCGAQTVDSTVGTDHYPVVTRFTL